MGKFYARALTFAVCFTLLAACGPTSGTEGQQVASVTAFDLATNASITISPTTKIMLTSAAPIQLAATVTGAGPAVVWSLSYDLGSISSTGLYTPPPSHTGYNTVIAVATSVDDPTLTGQVPLNVAPYDAAASAPATITISPTTTILTSPAPIQLTATVTGAGPAVVWSLSYDLGSISSSGLYTPPPAQTTYNTVIATATSTNISTLSATVAIHLGPYTSDATTPAPSPSPSPAPAPAPTPVPAAAPAPTPPPPANGRASRPTYNKGVGFFVLGDKLYDANGVEFRVRGTNKVHWDNGSPGLPASRANTVRWNVDFTRDPSSNVALLQGGANQASGTINDKMVVIPGNWDGTCSEDPAVVASIVDTWVAQAATWTQPAFEKFSIINIANEWGPSNSTVWRDSYISAVTRLRAAGYHATLSVTSGGCGQDNDDIVLYGQAVLDSDPEKNVIFDQHVYGTYFDAAAGVPGVYAGQFDLTSAAAALKATGLAVMFGEFGPGRDIGPSPTLVTPTRVIQIAESMGIGWLAWAWDDNDLANAQADDQWFALSYNGGYQSTADLTIFGRAVVEDPTWGMKALATPASIF